MPTVSVEITKPRGIASVRARMPRRSIPAVFPQYLNQVYAAGRDGALPLDGQNIFVYRAASSGENEIDVEFGVGVTTPFAPSGPVAYSPLPVGEVATATHWGDYAKLGDAHAAILDWCRANAREMAGTSWEVYGHWREGVTPRTDVYYLLKPAS